MAEVGAIAVAASIAFAEGRGWGVADGTEVGARVGFWGGAVVAEGCDVDVAIACLVAVGGSAVAVGTVDILFTHSVIYSAGGASKPNIGRK